MKKIFAVIFSILFVIALVISIFLYSFEKKAFDAETYKNALQNENIYERMPAMLANQLVASNENSSGAVTKNLTAKDWEILLSALVPPEELENIGERAIDEVFELLNGNANYASVPLDGIKESLKSEESIDIILSILESQPPCTAIDSINLVSGEMPFCNPPEATKPLIKPFLQNQLIIAADNLPDEKVFLEKSTMGTELTDLQALRLLMRLSPLVPMILLLLITITIIRSLKTWLRWWGIPFIIAGGTTLFLSILSGPLLDKTLTYSLFEKEFPIETSEFIIQTISDIVLQITHSIVENIALYALILISLGIGMTIASLFVGKREETK